MIISFVMSISFGHQVWLNQIGMINIKSTLSSLAFSKNFPIIKTEGLHMGVPSASSARRCLFPHFLRLSPNHRIFPAVYFKCWQTGHYLCNNEGLVEKPNLTEPVYREAEIPKILPSL